MIVDYSSLQRALRRGPQCTGPVPPGYEEDAVCLLLFDRPETMLLVVQKADNEGYFWRNHIALPGGQIDPSDRHARDAALRELEEELSIHPSEVEVLGNMGHFQTQSSRNDLEVIVGRWTRPSNLRVDRREIERTLELPLARMVELHVRGGFRSRPANSIGSALVYPLSDVNIWGVTARILHKFLELVLSHETLIRQSS